VLKIIPNFKHFFQSYCFEIKYGTTPGAHVARHNDEPFDNPKPIDNIKIPKMPKISVAMNDPSGFDLTIFFYEIYLFNTIILHCIYYLFG